MNFCFKTRILFVFFSLLLSSSFLTGCKKPPYKEARYLMGTLNEIQIFGLSRAEARAAAQSAFEAMQQVDTLMSLYKENSEISRIKKLSPGEKFPVSKETFTVLNRAREIARLSEGAFDVTVGPLVRRWGFFKKEGGNVLTQNEIASILSRCGYEKLELVQETQSVKVTAKELEVDLGGIAKGYAIDLALKKLKEAGVQSGLVNSGGNIGFLGRPPNNKEWVVGIKNPYNLSTLIGSLKIPEGAVSTSGNYENYFIVNGKRYSHILDPRTGWPVEGILSVTVMAPTGMDADALSTTLFVMGPEKGIPLAEELGAQVLYVLEKEPHEMEFRYSPGLESSLF